MEQARGDLCERACAPLFRCRFRLGLEQDGFRERQLEEQSVVHVRWVRSSGAPNGFQLLVRFDGFHGPGFQVLREIISQVDEEMTAYQQRLSSKFPVLISRREPQRISPLLPPLLRLKLIHLSHRLLHHLLQPPPLFLLPHFPLNSLPQLPIVLLPRVVQPRLLRLAPQI
jgi:hypothetical protein